MTSEASSAWPRPRRSWLVVGADRTEEIRAAGAAKPDVVVLDLVEFVVERNKPNARAGVASAVALLRGAGSEIFVQIDANRLSEDVDAAARPGVTGVMLCNVEAVDQVTNCAELLSVLEEARDLGKSASREALEIALALETASANWCAYELSTASDRVTTISLGRADLKMDLRPEPSGEIHLLSFLMQRLMLIASAAGVAALGAWWLAPDRGLLATPERTYAAARKGRALGFSGSLCIVPQQVEALTRAFTISRDESDAAERVVTLFDELMRTEPDTLVLEIDGVQFARPEIDQMRRRIITAGSSGAPHR